MGEKKVRESYTLLESAAVDCIELPDCPGTKTLRFREFICFLTLDHDPDVANPCTDWDGFGMIRSLSRKHINHIDYEEAKTLLDSDPDVVALSYFEHGQSLWMVAELPAPAGVEFQWDGVRFAGVWIPDKCVRESYTGQDGLTRREWMVEQAKSACETYTAWANGQCFSYSISLFKQRGPFDSRSDYRFDKPIFEESCGGFIGDSYKEDMRTAIRDAIKAAGKEA